MKLEFESNAVSSPLVNNFSPDELDTHKGSPETIQMLRDGISAAQEGDRASARNLLLRVTESDPRNENAWLWLASISEYPEELLVFLNNVLEINPENQKALEWAKATKSLIGKTFVQRGIDAAKDDQKKFARQCFMQAIVHDSGSELAYLWLASVSDSPEEKISHLNKVLSINPENANALKSLKNAREIEAKAKLPKANSFAINGNHIEARVMLDEIIADAPDFEDAWMLKAHISEHFSDKIAAFNRVLEINPENPVAKVNVDSLSMFAEISGEEVARPHDSSVFQGYDSGVELPINMPRQSFMDQPTQSMIEEVPYAEAVESPESPESDDSEIYAAESEPEIHAEAESTADETPVFQEEEAIAFDEIAGPLETEEFDQVFEGEEILVSKADPDFEIEEDDDEVLSLDHDMSGDPEHASDEEEPVFSEVLESSDEEFEMSQDTNEVDHDYVSESVDYQEDSEEEEMHLEHEAEAADSHEVDEAAEEVSFEEEEMSFDSEDEDRQAEAGADDSQASFESVEEEVDDQEAEQAFESYDEPEAGEEAVSFDDSSEAQYAEDVNEATAEVEPEASFDESTDDYSEDLNSEDESDAHFDDFQAEESEQNHEPEMPNFASGSDFAPEMPSDVNASESACPYCDFQNDHQSFACHQCKAIFTISDIEMILTHDKADKEIISNALKRMETDKTLRGVDANELKHLGVGYINLKEYRKGFEYLQDALKKNPSDVILSSQIDALAVRVAEIEGKDRAGGAEVKSKRILVVDDSPTVRKLISGKLEKCGHEAICAVDGMDALAKINEVIPDLILLDITMPRMDGYQVCKLIRSNDATKDVPVVMISGKDGFFDKVRGRMAGTSNYITKPFGPETLMKTVKEYIQ